MYSYNVRFIFIYYCLYLSLQILVGYNKLRMLPSPDDVKKDLYKHDTQPYIVMRDAVIQSILPESGAIRLINMYCSSLLKSKFVHLSPIWTLYEQKEDITYRVLYIFYAYIL